MTAPVHIEPDELLKQLRLLCAQPSTSGDTNQLEPASRIVADMLRHTGLDIRIVRAGGAPIIIGWRGGRRPFTLLLYHHYDVHTTGPWRDWLHNPFELAERDDNVYARGVANGKGPFIAHLMAIQALLELDGELPHGVVFIVEGERMSGSPMLEQVIKRYADQLHVHACLGTAGERDAYGRPFCYNGSKGLLQVRLSTKGPAMPLAPPTSASVPNPAWRVSWALSSIKGMDEDIRINGFYDSIEGPGRNVRSMLREVALDEEGRLAAWDVPEFLFGMSKATLVRTEVTLPTCNLSSFTVEPNSAISSLPSAATAQLEFHLVPNQQPENILNLLRKHLVERGLKDILVEKVPGSYPPVQSNLDHPFIQHLLETGHNFYDAPLSFLPFGLFSQPLYVFAQHLNTPVAALALSRHDSSEHGPNEHIPMEDLLNHGRFLIEFMMSEHEFASEIAVAE